MSKSTVLVQATTFAAAFSLTACIAYQCPSPDTAPAEKTQTPIILGQDTVHAAETQIGNRTEMQVVTGDSATQILDQFKLTTPDQPQDVTPTVLVQTRVDTVLMMLPPCDKTHFIKQKLLARQAGPVLILPCHLLPRPVLPEQIPRYPQYGN